MMLNQLESGAKNISELAENLIQMKQQYTAPYRRARILAGVVREVRDPALIMARFSLPNLTNVCEAYTATRDVGQRMRSSQRKLLRVNLTL